MVGIFHKKPGDFGSMFGRNKKEKMTSKENEDERSLVGEYLKPSTKPSRKTSRKTKYSAKFRRLQDELDENSDPPEYEPPEGLYEPPNGLAFPQQAGKGSEGEDPLVPDAIDISGSASDTISTLEGSLVEILRKQHMKKNEQKEQKSKKQYDKKRVLGGKPSPWILNFANKSFDNHAEDDFKIDEAKDADKGKKERKLVQPKFYPLEDSPSSGSSSGFGRPTFDDPFSHRDEGNINFTCSEDYENDENVEKISSVGSDDFHQFVVKMPPIRNAASDGKPKSKRDKMMKKAAQTIATSLSASTPPKLHGRMVPMDSGSKRAKKKLNETKRERSHTSTKPARPVRQEVSSESKRLHPSSSEMSRGQSVKSETPRFMLGISASSSKPASIHSCTDDSVLMGQNSSDDSLLKDISRQSDLELKPKQDTGAQKDLVDGVKVEQADDADPFHIGTFSQRSDCLYLSSDSGSPNPSTEKQASELFVKSRDDLIDLIRSASQRSDDESSKKPDPSPKSCEERSFEPTPPSTFRTRTRDKTFQEKDLSKEQFDKDKKGIFPTKSSMSGNSAAPSNPSGVPANAILGSMLFRHAHSESTMALPGESGRPSDPFNTDEHDMLSHLDLDMMDQQTVSSVTEDAGSFYHENFESWNNRAHRALNNLYSTYHSASANLNAYRRGGQDGPKGGPRFEA